VGKQLAAQLSQALLSDHHGRIILPVEENEFADQGAGIEQTSNGQTVRVIMGDIAIDGELEDVGLREQKRGRYRQADQGGEELPTVGTHVAP